ncbi:unnamed protein product [Allacma fusca]|uniref:C2H2-type domain-containing protein n=1 Tax=Allacma fusca TaxID=39272 RepID=A0A8J2PIK9_9HEXA|nr:unnamed protein product [Allacma fusca]
MPERCSLCDYRSSTSQKLTLHVENAHGPGTITPGKVSFFKSLSILNVPRKIKGASSMKAAKDEGPERDSHGHVKLEDGNVSDLFDCPLCTYECTQLSELRIHARVVHLKEKLPTTDLPAPSIPPLNHQELRVPTKAQLKETTGKLNNDELGSNLTSPTQNISRNNVRAPGAELKKEPLEPSSQTLLEPNEKQPLRPPTKAQLKEFPQEFPPKLTPVAPRPKPRGRKSKRKLSDDSNYSPPISFKGYRRSHTTEDRSSDSGPEYTARCKIRRRKRLDGRKNRSLKRRQCTFRIVNTSPVKHREHLRRRTHVK